MFQDHHVLPQKFADHPVIRLLGARFNHDAIRNLVALPSRQPLATELSSSPHTGGHLRTYYKGFCDYLEKIRVSPRFDVASAGDARALNEIASDVNALVAAAKYAVVNGDLLPNTPEKMTTEEANGKNNGWFSNREKYAADNAEQIRQMEETIDQLYNAGQRDAALYWPLTSPTSDLSMAERIEILERSRKSSPISLQFTSIGPVPDLPGLVPPFVDTRLPGFIPPSPEGTNKPEGFTPSNPLLTYGLPGFPVPPSGWRRLMQVPPSVAMPPEPQVLQFHSETGQPLTRLSDGSQVLGPQAPPDQGSASLMGAAVLGTGAMMIPGVQGLGAALLAGSTVAALTRPAFPATISSDAKVADGSVFSNGAAPYKPFDVNVPVQRLDNGWGDPLEPSASTFADRFGNWTDTPAGTMPAQNVQQAPTPPAAGAVAPEEVRRLTRVNATNASSVFTSGSAPVPYLPSTEFDDRFGSWSKPTGEGRAQQANMPIGAFADEPPYIIPPPIFGVDDPGHPRNDAEEWFARWIRPLLRPE
ncbi:AHH domain-containing protein [Bradyrhizobium sp. 521_C7_N1_3]|uniref:AHH domain-containing protein n=1 Tax=Bradyrhizobium sp. 521_C7_N1_3 TaxID=3240368 RepID=UPI003F896CE5